MTGIIKKATLVGVLMTLGACSSMTKIDKLSAQAYAFAVKGFAERINGTVNSSTTVEIKNDIRTTRTFVEHSVQNTVIREHLEVKRKSYELVETGNVHTYVRIKMPLETFNNLIAEADNAQVSTTSSNSN